MIFIGEIYFTTREFDVLSCMLNARGSKKISNILLISPRTVEVHIQNIMLKIGCNSQDSVIDFIEKSDKSSHARQHYMDLLVNASFEQILKKISYLTTKLKKSCLIHYKGKNETLGLLKKHLQLAGIDITVSEKYFSDKIKNEYDYVTYALSRDMPLEFSVDNIIKNYLENKKKSKKLSFLALDGVVSKIIPTNLDDVVRIDLHDNKKYYFSIFQLLKQIFIEINLDKFIEEFKKFRSNINESKLNNISENIIVKSSIDTKEKNSTQNYHYYLFKRFKSNTLSNLSALLSAIILVILVLFANHIFKYDVETSEYVENAILAKKYDKNENDNALLKETEKCHSNYNYHTNLSNSFVYEKNNYFIEPRGIFGKIDNILNKNQYVIITGSPGVGKSSCASEYTRRVVSNSKNNNLIIRSLSASTNSSIYNQYLEIAREHGQIDVDKLSKELVIKKVHSYLANIGKVILVFDNVDNYDNVTEYLKNMPLNIKLIITSRNNSLPKSLNNNYQVKLAPFTKSESIKYLKLVLEDRVKSGQVSDTELNKFVEELGSPDWAMAYKLDKVAAWFKEKQQAGIDEYVKKHKSGEEEGGESALLFDLLKDSPRAWEIMQYASYLDPDFIGMQILYKLFEQSPNDKHLLDKEISRLQELSLIEFSRKDEGNGIKIHRLTQEMIRKYVLRKNSKNIKTKHIPRRKILSSLVKIVDDLMPFVSSNPDITWKTASNLHNNVVNLLKHASNPNIKNKISQVNDPQIKLIIARLYNKLGSYYKNVAYMYEDSLDCYMNSEKFYAELRDNSKNIQQIKTEVLVNKGLCYCSMKKLDESLDCFNKALNLIESGGNTLKKVTADALNAKGIVYNKKCTDSLELYKNHSKIYKNLSENFGKNCNCKNNKSKNHDNVKEIYAEKQKVFKENAQKSLEYFNKSLDIRKLLYTNGIHQDIASSLNNIAKVYIKLGGKDNLVKALDYQLKSLQIRTQLSQGNLNQELTESYFYLGETYKLLGDVLRSINFFEKAKSSVYQIYHTYNHDIAINTLKKIGEIHESIGNVVEATEYYKKGYSIIKKYSEKINSSEVRDLRKKNEIYAPEFLSNSDHRIFINKYGGVDEKIYNIKSAIQNDILDNLYHYAKQGRWKNRWFSNGVSKYISDEYIEAVLNTNLPQTIKKNTLKEELKIAKSLCFEAINLGIMSASNTNRYFNCMIKFAKKYPELIKEIVQNHPEYFVDGSLLIKCIEEGLIDAELATILIDMKEEYRPISRTTKKKS